MKPVTVPCSRCRGTGKRAVTGKYAETLALLRRYPESTGADLAKAVGCKATAMNNRLVALENMGLVKSVWYGRRRLYTARS